MYVLCKIVKFKLLLLINILYRRNKEGITCMYIKYTPDQ
jgi:hypothetical protein